MEFWENFCPWLKGEYIKNARRIVAYSLLSRADRGENLNILLVGDSASGKSEILRALDRIFDFCHFVSTSTTSAGLSFDARWGGKEGIAIKAKGGFLLVDEFDKQKDEIYKVLLEIMDKHTVTITKGSIRKVFKAETNIIGSCNQKNFRWDSIDINEIPLPFVLLTRFHLIIPLGSLDANYYPDIAKNYGDGAKLKFTEQEERFKYYIEKLRDIKVTISEEMSEYAGIFFMHMKKIGLDEYFPITPRQIEGFVNLSKCVARSMGKSMVDKECLKKTAEIFTGVIKNYMLLGKEIGVLTEKLKRFKVV